MDTQTTVVHPVEDKRLRPPYPVPADGKEELVTRSELARVAGVNVRTVSRWVRAGYLTKYTNARGEVMFDARQGRAMNTFEPDGGSD